MQYVSFKMVSELVREEGYSTHMVGKWHLGYCAWDYTPTRCLHIYNIYDIYLLCLQIYLQI